MRKAALPGAAIACLIGCLALPEAGQEARVPGFPELRFETRLRGRLDQGPGAAGAGLGVGFGEAFLLPFFGLTIEGDPLLSSWLLETTLGLGLGAGLEMYLSVTEPLGDARLDTGGGRSLFLTRSTLPSGLGARARLGRAKVAQASWLDVFAIVSWTAWGLAGVESSEGSLGYASEDALRVFTAGFSFGLAARLSVPLSGERSFGP